MTKKELIEIIRKVVKSEVKKAINEVKHPRLDKASSKSTLQEVLAQTEQQDDWKTMGTFNASDARARFASMQGGVAGAQANLLNQPAVQNDESLQKAFTRDYSELVKAMQKK